MSSQNCEAITAQGFSCLNRSRFTTNQNKHYCKIHWKQLVSDTFPEEDTTECTICYESVKNKDSIRTVCNHAFCKKCFKKWTKHHDTCPLCRTIVKTTDQNTSDTLNGSDLYTLIHHLIHENRLYVDQNVLRIANAYDHEHSIVQQLEQQSEHAIIIQIST